MLLGKKNNDSDEKDENNELLIMSYIQQSKFEDALDLLKKTDDIFFVTYNKIICYFFDGHLEKAIEQIGKAIEMLSNDKESTTDIDPLMLFEMGIKSLDGDKSYLDPISSKYAILFPDEVKKNLLRLQIDIFVQQKKWDEIREVINDNNKINLLSHQNVKDAIKLANQ